MYQTTVPNGGSTKRNEYYDRFLKGTMESEDNIHRAMLYGEKGLILASLEGNADAVDKLLAPDIDVNTAFGFNERGKGWTIWTALSAASEGGHSEIVKRLLAHDGIDVNKATMGRGTALFIASQKGHTEIVTRLLAHPGIDVNKARTSAKGHTEIVKRLMTHPDIDVNKALTRGGETALIVASAKGHTEIVERLLVHPDIDAITKANCGRTALDVAGVAEVVSMLKAHEKSRKKKKKKCVHCKKSFNKKLKICQLCGCRCCTDCHMYHLVSSCSEISSETRDRVVRSLQKRNEHLGKR